MKILYVDCETTGLNAYKNGIIQLAGIIEINNKQMVEFDIKMKPFKDDIIEEKALQVSGITEKDIEKFQSAESGYNKIIQIFDTYINKYDKNDKFIICGYNVKFDVDFLKQFFIKNGNKFLFSYFGGIKDLFLVIRYLSSLGKIQTKNKQLGTVCEHFGIELKDAHNAMADIIATKKLAEKIDELFNDIKIKK